MHISLPENLKATLKKQFGFSHFRPGQEEVLVSLQAGQSLLGLMPTGSGKSLTYQLWSVTQPGLVLVVTPLIALMEDQAHKAKQFGIEVGFIHSQVPSEEKAQRLQNLSTGKYRLFFATPERLQKPEFQEALRKCQLSLFVVDEAHCISLWGHDFRPDYAKLGGIRKSLGEPLTLALTATATPDVQKQILESLNLNEAPILSEGLERENIAVSVREAYGLEAKLEDLVPHVQKRTGSALIYVTLIRTAEEVRRTLQKMNVECMIYHGDLPPQKRRAALKNFMKDEKALMVATPAFGLGIDKPNIRTVYHLEPTSSLESYFQEIGRAGRDGEMSQAILYYDEEDLTIPMQFIQSAHPERSYIEQMYKLIQKNQDRVRSEGRAYLAEQISFKNRGDHRVDSALNILERWGCIEQTENGIELVAELKPEFFTLENQQELLKHHNKKLYAYLQWIKNTSVCRMNQIYKYFGHEENEDCGICDNCRSDT